MVSGIASRYVSSRRDYLGIALNIFLDMLVHNWQHVRRAIISSSIRSNLGPRSLFDFLSSCRFSEDFFVAREESFYFGSRVSLRSLGERMREGCRGKHFGLISGKKCDISLFHTLLAPSTDGLFAGASSSTHSSTTGVFGCPSILANCDTVRIVGHPRISCQ